MKTPAWSAAHSGLTRRWRAATLRLALTVAGLLLCAATLLADELPEALRIGVITTYVDGKPFNIGASNVVVEDGWLDAELRKRGVRLEWVPISEENVGPLANEALAAKRIDFIAYGDLPAIIVNAGGVATRLIVPSGRGGDTYLVVPASSPVRSVEELKGKRVAVHRGRPWELPFVRLIDSRGLNYRDFHIFNANPYTGAAAMVAGKIDAIFVPSAYQLEDKGVGRIIWSTKTAPLDWKTGGGVWGASAFIERYPQLTQLVATAHVRAAHWSSQEANRNEVIRRASLTGTPESVIRRQYEDVNLLWRERWSPLTDATVYAHYREAVRFAVDKKLIRRSLDVEGLIDPRFVDTALTQLGLREYWSVSAPLAAAH